ncbi:cytosolic factor, phosphatidylinositol/phosphatidylcholine transfer protein [Chytridiales sp. JEL 0842]|nr:cytosolic factor, phosphatidylinositol/phosphatidylcholine transfer protein [Chytridiales sp. JEL 0842]
MEDLRRLVGPDSKHDDASLQRFLTARQGNAAKAYEMLVECDRWRRDEKIDELPMYGSPGAPFLCNVRGFQSNPDTNVQLDHENTPPEFKKFFPFMGGFSFHKLDKEGRPIMIERLGKFDIKGLYQHCTVDSLMDQHIRNQEYGIRVVMLEASKRAGRVIDKLYMPALSLLKALADHDAKYYPERLGMLFVTNAPFFFTKVWAIIKKWLDKGILEKVHILGKDEVKKTLLKHIDADSLPDFLGGNCKCAHMPGGCVPIPRELGYVDTSEAPLTETANLKDPHHYEVTVAMEELVEFASQKLTYRFKSTKKVSLEVRHRKFGADEEKVVMATTQFDSHVSTTVGEFKAEPGVYTFSWKKASKGLMMGSVSVSYAVDVEYEDLADATASMSISNAAPASVTDDDEDDDDFADAEEN